MISWTVAVSAVICGVLFPHLWLIIALGYIGYFLARMAFTLVFTIVGDVKLHRWGKRDWLAGYDEAGPHGLAPRDVHHVVVVPSYQEPSDILRRTLDALADQHMAAERLIVVLAMEEREKGHAAKAAELTAEYGSRFEHISYTVHPIGLPDEVAGKSSNEAWAARFVPEIVESLGVDPDVVTVTSCDADSVFHRRYFAALAQLFAADESRHNRFWQAPLFFYNNLWQVPAGVRLSTWFSQSVQLSELAAPRFHALPISTYTFSMRLAIGSGWWDASVIPEDWHTFLAAQFARRGDVTLVPIFLATHGDATDGATWAEAMQSRNLQLTRHAWGAEDVGWIADQLAWRRDYWKPFAIFRFFQVLHDHLIRTVSWFMLTSAWAVSSWLSQQRVPGLHFTPFGTELTFLSWGFTAGGALMMLTLIVDIVRNPPPDSYPIWRVPIELAVMWFTTPLTGWYFGCAPALTAQTKLMLGIPIGYRVTPKRLVAATANNQSRS